MKMKKKIKKGKNVYIIYKKENKIKRNDSI